MEEEGLMEKKNGYRRAAWRPIQREMNLLMRLTLFSPAHFGPHSVLNCSDLIVHSTALLFHPSTTTSHRLHRLKLDLTYL